MKLLGLVGDEILQVDIGLKPGGGKFFAIRKMKRSDLTLYTGKEAAADARLLGISFQGVARSERQWRDLSREIRQEESWATYSNLVRAIHQSKARWADRSPQMVVTGAWVEAGQLGNGRA